MYGRYNRSRGCFVPRVWIREEFLDPLNHRTIHNIHSFLLVTAARLTGVELKSTSDLLDAKREIEKDLVMSGEFILLIRDDDKGIHPPDIDFCTKLSTWREVITGAHMWICTRRRRRCNRQ
jgi:hypothetical protein